MIKNVLFDFGKVLVDFEPMYMSRYVTDEEDRRLVSQVVFDRIYWDKLDAGTISDAAVVAMVKERLPQRLWDVAEKVYYNWIYNLPEIEGMRDVIAFLEEKGVKLGIVSNISLLFAEHCNEVPIINLIENRVFSSVCGYTKPDADIFKYALDKFSFIAEETLFVDDRAENVDGAAQVGISGYVFDGDAQKLLSYLKQKIEG